MVLETRVDWEGEQGISSHNHIVHVAEKTMPNTVVYSCQNSPKGMLKFVHFPVCILCLMKKEQGRRREEELGKMTP